MATYWESYRVTLGPAHLWPLDEGQTHMLLDLFTLEKALDQIEYTLSSGPSSAYIPIEATLRMLRQRKVIG